MKIAKNSSFLQDSGLTNAGLIFLKNKRLLFPDSAYGSLNVSYRHFRVPGIPKRNKKIHSHCYCY